MDNILSIDYDPYEFMQWLYENQYIIDQNIKDKKTFIKNIWKYPEFGERCEVCYF